LFVLTYGVLVTQLLKDFEDVNDVNKEIEIIGYNIGIKLIDELLSKTQLVTSCSSFKDAIEAVAKVGFKMFLGVNVDLVNWSKDFTEVTLCLATNPLTDFVELPDDIQRGLKYSNIYCGAIRGALEQVRLNVNCKYANDKLQSQTNSTGIVEKDSITVKLK
jgi:trafficking protein particle complex subunit 3